MDVDLTGHDLTGHLERERTPGDLKAILLEVYRSQENLIYAQQDALMRLLHENTEQEAVINELMREKV